MGMRNVFRDTEGESAPSTLRACRPHVHHACTPGRPCGQVSLVHRRSETWSAGRECI
ncbi:hypothetical protein FA95DRAFT_1567308 [Auriscalpium vulgare]|uniref:Uncharacterized protein n=1 Tax=Auriscalpium vulgare TaxID=40419 RepID=A0ACB8R565_9AGAM|nr:hypothetical protein FA95DRAFT_1567308 [Auriscalpium vulgare]